MPGYSPLPPGPAPRGSGKRRWRALVSAGVIGGTIASLAAAVIIVQTRDTGATTKAAPVPTPVTVTVGAPSPARPSPLPAAQADRQTCQQGWVPAGNLADAAVRALQVLPAGVKVGDPAIQSNPEWAAAVQNAADSYRRAGDTLDSAVTPGTTPVLAEAAHTAVKALRLLGDSISKGDPVNGNAGEIVDAAGGQVGVLCTRLAP
jgi:hypothetical protein